MAVSKTTRYTLFLPAVLLVGLGAMRFMDLQRYTLPVEAQVVEVTSISKGYDVRLSYTGPDGQTHEAHFTHNGTSRDYIAGRTTPVLIDPDSPSAYVLEDKKSNTMPVLLILAGFGFAGFMRGLLKRAAEQETS